MPQIGADPKHSLSPAAAEETASERKRGRPRKVLSSPDPPAAEELDAAAGMSQWRRRWLAKHSPSPSSLAPVVAPPAVAGLSQPKRGPWAKHSSSPSSPAPDVSRLPQPKRGQRAKHSSSPSSPAPAPVVVDAPAVDENLDAAAGMSQWRRNWLAKQSSTPSSPVPGTIVAGRIASLRKRSESVAEPPSEAPSLRKRGKESRRRSLAKESADHGKGPSH